MLDDKDLSESTLRLLVWQARKKWPTRSLISLVLDPDPIVRTGAAKELHMRRSPEIYEKAKKLCAHRRDDAREIGAFVLGQLGTPKFPFRTKSIPILANLLSRDRSADVRAAAAASLGHLNANEAIDQLVRAAKDSNVVVRECVAFALGFLEPSEEVERVAHTLAKDKDKDVRGWAKLSLESLHDKKSARTDRRKGQRREKNAKK